MSLPVNVIDARSDPTAASRRLSEMAAAGLPPVVMERTLEIVQAVAERGDDALVEYTRTFDWSAATVEDLAVDEAEMEAAFEEVDRDWLQALRRAKESLYAYHERQAPRSWLQDFDGLLLGQHIKPVASAGLYAPGKAAPLPSTVIHCAVPAQVAGVPRLVVVSPPRADGSLHPTLLVAAYECGIAEVYRVGGAQAIAALAFGTETIPAVAKIVGPGNAYVTAAKRLVFGQVGIDSLAGPSEAAIIADAQADPALVAADFLAQAEHTGDNLVVLLTPDDDLVDAVVAEIEKLLSRLDREDIISQSLAECGAIVLVDSVQQALDMANEMAPEHLQLLIADPLSCLNEVQAAGAIFLGASSPVPLGDYLAGPSHVLPTNKAARFSSGLSVWDFVTASSVIMASGSVLQAKGADVITLAEAEGLSAHAETIRLRLGSAASEGRSWCPRGA
ncbi:MAG: histidinol dehydrogenase [Armatimonadetes bacterium]|nr:histidinol dehydrogenase [Armatimonadota bacterium]